MDARKRLLEAHRVVVKVGTSTLTHATGKLDLYRIEHLLRELADLRNAGKEILLVSSGAIAAGMGRVGLAEKPAEIEKKQALAAIGQGILMQIYEKIFFEYGILIGQVLLTKENAVRHNQYAHSRAALLSMLDMGIVPVINENDAVSVDEIKIGDNDNLSAIVATLVDADALVLLTDIDGLYTADPRTHADAEKLDTVEEITPEILDLAGGVGSKLGTGGMATKLEAAQIAMSAGVTMVIAPGGEAGCIRRILHGEPVGTVFPAREAHLKVRKSWLAFGKRLTGEVTVDDGCRAALQHGSSLLAAGILSAEGDFRAGGTVRVLDEGGREIARGIVNFSAGELAGLIGRKTEDFPELFEGRKHKEVIHRDDMVLMI